MTGRTIAEKLIRFSHRENIPLETLLILFKKDFARYRGVPLIKTVFKYVLRHLENERQVQTLHITTSHALSPGALDRLKILVKGEGGAPLQETIDPRLLGGVILKYYHKQLDASLTTALKNLRTKLLTT